MSVRLSQTALQPSLPGIPEASPWAQRAAYGQDPVALAVMSELNHARERERESIGHRGTLCQMDILAIAAELRRKAEAGDTLATLRATAAVLNVSVEVIPYLALRAGKALAVHLDVPGGHIHIDFRRTVTPRAARPKRPGITHPSSLTLLVALPQFLADAIRQAFARRPSARTFGDLFGFEVPDGHLPILDGEMGRLRSTPVRFRRSLPILLMDLGVDRYYAALVTCAFHLVPRARYYYTLSHATTISEVRRRDYNAIGWGEPTEVPAEKPFGSSVVATPRSLQSAWTYLIDSVERLRPPRRWTLNGVIAFHNAYVMAVVWLFVFCTGARQMRVLRFTASTCVEGITHLKLADKRVGDHELHVSVVLCEAARQVLNMYWTHLRELLRRARAAGDVNSPWVGHLERIDRHDPVHLFFLIQGRHAVPFGTRRMLATLPKADRPVPNWARHFWQTLLLFRGLTSSWINVWARHIPVGDEFNSSTSILTRSEVQAALAREQNDVLAELGIAAVCGLGPRSGS